MNVTWNNLTTDTNQSTGYFTNANNLRTVVAEFTASTLKLVKPNSLVKFQAPSGYHFMTDNNNELMLGAADHPGSKEYLWTKVVNIQGNGTITQEDGTGPIVFNDIIPSGAILVEIIPRIATSLQTQVINQIIDQTFAYRTFGLRFDQTASEWRIVTENNLSIGTEFSTGKSGYCSTVNGLAPGSIPSICTVSNGINSVPSFNQGPFMFVQFCTYGEVVQSVPGRISTHQPGARNARKVI